MKIRTVCLSASVILLEATAAALLLSPAMSAKDEKPAPKVSAPHPAAAKAPGAAGGAAKGPAAGGAAGRPGGPGGAAAGGRGGAPGGNLGGRGGAPGGARGGQAARVGGERGGGAGRGPEPRGVSHENRGGHDVARRADGRPRDVHTAGGHDIHHGLDGHREVRMERADHSRVFAERGGRGYVQRRYDFHGHEFGHRTYWRDGRAYDRFYGRYEYRPGIFLDVYAPVRYYPVGFYGWAYNPWVAPVSYAWGFAANPWYGVYGAYFTPYPVYANASLWLTDYLISQSLAAAYSAQAAAQVQMQALAPAVAMSREVQDLIAAEVRNQVALENAEAQANAQAADFNGQSSGIARLLSDGRSHAFMVGASLDLVDAATNQECAVSQGDVLQLLAPPPPGAPAATLMVKAAKGGIECRPGAMVSVDFAALQDMQNHMRETVDEGLTNLQAHTGGLPTPPPSAMAMATPAAFAMNAPPPDPQAGAQINQQFTEADTAEKAALSPIAAPAAPTDAPAPAAAPPAPVSVNLGQSTDEVIAAMGQPTKILDVGTKKIYTYKDIKITFKDGKVTDVE